MTDEPDLEYPTQPKALAPEDTFRVLFLDTAAKIGRLKTTCKEVGYVVVGATTIAEAMAFLDGKDHADVIVCGAHLEDQSMFSFLERVRGDARHRKTMFLILSLEPGIVAARLDRSARLAGLALGADAYAIMPSFDPHVLLGQIRELRPEVPLLQQSSEAEKQRSG